MLNKEDVKAVLKLCVRVNTVKVQCWLFVTISCQTFTIKCFYCFSVIIQMKSVTVTHSCTCVNTRVGATAL